MTRPTIDRLSRALEGAGLVRDRGNGIFELHPALTGYLRASIARAADPALLDLWTRAFVDVMARFAGALAPGELYEQRVPFHVHGANFHHALTQAERLKLDTPFAALVQSLAAYAQNTRDFAAAARLFTRLADARRDAGDEEREAGAYHQLGIIAQEQRDFAAA